MERIFIIISLLFVSSLSWAQDSASEQSDVATPAEVLDGASGENGGETEREAEAKKETPKKKVRTGSYIISDRPVFVSADLRGDFNRRRDYEVTRHFRRLAKLAVIESLAAKKGDSSVADRVERIRRIEKKRYRKALQLLRLASQYKTEVGTK